MSGTPRTTAHFVLYRKAVSEVDPCWGQPTFISGSHELHANSPRRISPGGRGAPDMFPMQIRGATLRSAAGPWIVETYVLQKIVSVMPCYMPLLL